MSLSVRFIHVFFAVAFSGSPAQQSGCPQHLFCFQTACRSPVLLVTNAGDTFRCRRTHNHSGFKGDQNTSEVTDLFGFFFQLYWDVVTDNIVICLKCPMGWFDTCMHSERTPTVELINTSTGRSPTSSFKYFPTFLLLHIILEEYHQVLFTFCIVFLDLVLKWDLLGWCVFFF